MTANFVSSVCVFAIFLCFLTSTFLASFFPILHCFSLLENDVNDFK